MQPKEPKDITPRDPYYKFESKSQRRGAEGKKIRAKDGRNGSNINNRRESKNKNDGNE